MPFRGFTVPVEIGKSEPAYTAVEGDIHVKIRASALPGQSQGSSVYSIAVGGPEMRDDHGAGLFCPDGTFASDVDAGDALWVAIADGAAPWTGSPVAVTVLVRSARRDGADDDAGGS